VDARHGSFDFLGYHFEGTQRWVREKSHTRLKETLRGKTKRTSGQSLKSIIAAVNRTLRGWFAYFQNSSRKSDFDKVDRFVRQRLRSILKKRTKRKGCAKGGDDHRWKNAFFTDQGLYSLVAAHASARQSLRR